MPQTETPLRAGACNSNLLLHLFVHRKAWWNSSEGKSSSRIDESRSSTHWIDSTDHQIVNARARRGAIEEYRARVVDREVPLRRLRHLVNHIALRIYNDGSLRTSFEISDTGIMPEKKPACPTTTSS
jgi:hypothetical protein